MNINHKHKLQFYPSTLILSKK